MWMTSFSWGRWGNDCSRCKHRPDSPVPLPGLLPWRWGCVEHGSRHEKERRESPHWQQLLLLLAASAPGPLACAWASSERPVQQLLLPGVDRKGKAEGSSCLPRLNQVRLLEKGALRSRAAVPGERRWVGGGHDAAGHDGGTAGFG